MMNHMIIMVFSKRYSPHLLYEYIIFLEPAPMK